MKEVEIKNFNERTSSFFHLTGIKDNVVYLKSEQKIKSISYEKKEGKYFINYKTLSGSNPLEITDLVKEYAESLLK